MLDFIRIACAVPHVAVGDIARNVQRICAQMEEADKQTADLVLFPELCLTGYTCGDLFLQDLLWEGVRKGISEILACSRLYPSLCVVLGMPLRVGSSLANCAAAIKNGQILGITPKAYLSGFEGRSFVAGESLKETVVELSQIVPGQTGKVPFGTELLVDLGGGAVLGMEICEDLNAPIPPSTLAALNGANVIVNLSAANALAGKQEQRRKRVEAHSSACTCIYAYCSSGCGESTADTLYSGCSMIAANGRILEEMTGPSAGNYLLVADCDLGQIRHDRAANPTFRASAGKFATDSFVTVSAGDGELRSDGSGFRVRKNPFVPEQPEQRKVRCREIFQIQAEGLRQRLERIGAKAVVGVSGGLDSTLALLVAVEAARLSGKPASDVHALTMPCFGTTDRTYRNALELMGILGVTAKEIRIGDAVMKHFRDIGHDPSVRNTCYENAQARERTQVLMDYAGEVGGIVVGTGDLSELALGWCTYNGDHMSMYSVNGSVPKTLIPHLIETVAQEPFYAGAAHVLQDVIDTPISPELLPPDDAGKICQQTESLVGPYALHDFFLYHILRYGAAPKKVYFLACKAFAGEYTCSEVKKWLCVFYKRFFAQQFKRNCLPDGVKVGSVCLGPRGDWHMPSDASAKLWLAEAEEL